MRGRQQNPLHARAKREYPCPRCGARPGESCRKETGGIAWPPHTARIAAARPHEELREANRQAAFLFGALGHGGEHDQCDPCAFVRTHGEESS